MKRLTIDIPESLHIRVKSQCAKRGSKMADEIRTLLEGYFPKDRRFNNFRVDNWQTTSLPNQPELNRDVIESVVLKRDK